MIYRFLDWFDKCQPTIEFWGNIICGLVFWVSILFIIKYSWWPKSKGMMDKWDEGAKGNFGREITKHEKKGWE